jgi:hypothetical protein
MPSWPPSSSRVEFSHASFISSLCLQIRLRESLRAPVVLQVHTAVAAWRLVLQGRFRLLDRWCAYVGEHHKAAVILEDTWRQVRL